MTSNTSTRNTEINFQWVVHDTVASLSPPYQKKNQVHKYCDDKGGKRVGLAFARNDPWVKRTYCIARMRH